MPAQTGSRIVQITISTRDLGESVTFYSEVFDVEFDESISSFQFGTWQTDSFFLLTIENCADDPDRFRSSCFGMLVDDLETIHQRALGAGASEVQPPGDFSWKPRSSIVEDPSGNRIQLSQS